MVLGVLGLHPYHFDQYSLREVVNKLNGFNKDKKENWLVMRRMTYYIAAPHIKGLKIEEILPIEGDTKKEFKLAKVTKLNGS